MGAFEAKTAYFKDLSSQNKLVAHGQPVSEGSEETRVSFISVEDEEGLAAAVENGIHFPCVVMLSLRGKLTDKEASIRRQWSNVLWFLDKAIGNAESEAKKAVYEKTEIVMSQFISKMMDEMEEEGTCGPFKYLDMSAFFFEMTGRVSDGLFGWKLSFSDEASASDITNFDSTKWLSI